VLFDAFSGPDLIYLCGLHCFGTLPAPGKSFSHLGVFRAVTAEQHSSSHKSQSSVFLLAFESLL
jgi:hypothetical protein